MCKVKIVIENEEGAEVLDTHFTSIQSAVIYLQRHEKELEDNEATNAF